MTDAQRKEAHARLLQIAHDARRLIAYDGVTSPPDWRPFVAELADEMAKILVSTLPPACRRKKPRRKKRALRNSGNP